MKNKEKKIKIWFLKYQKILTFLSFIRN
jgi:hypothetical protein